MNYRKYCSTPHHASDVVAQRGEIGPCKERYAGSILGREPFGFVQLAITVQALDVNRVSVILFPNLVGSKGVLRDYPAHCQPIGLRFGDRFLRGLSGELRAYGPLSLLTYLLTLILN